MWLNSLLVLALCIGCAASASDAGARYFQTPMHEISQAPLYLTLNEHQEVVVSYAGKDVDLRPNDYITHADGIRILTGWPNGLDDFLQSGEKEAVVPIVDDNDEQFGGQRLKGFMLISAVRPRKLSLRRGEVQFDMEEGGPAPTMKLGNIVIGAGGAKSTSDPSYVPPPHGGGACISHRDCFPTFPTSEHNHHTGGLCKEGACDCLGDYTGSYCQLHRPQHAAVSMLVKKAASNAASPRTNNAQQQHQQQQEQQQDQLVQERARQERVQFETDRQEKAEREKAERERVQQEKVERERAQNEKALNEKSERERAERERAQNDKALNDKAERERAERERAEREKADREKVERERAERERAERERAERERAEREKGDREKAEREKVEREKGDRERAQEEKIMQEKVQREKDEREKVDAAVKPATVHTPIKLSFGAKKPTSAEPVVESAQPSHADSVDKSGSSSDGSRSSDGGAPTAQPSFAAMPTAHLQAQNAAAGNSCSPSSTPTSPTAVETQARDTNVDPPRADSQQQASQGQQQQQGQSQGQGGGETETGREADDGANGAVPNKPRLKKRRVKNKDDGGEEGNSAAGGSGGAPRRVVTGSGDVMDQQREKSLTMDDLYGEGKAYPDPYNAGKLPNNLVHERYRKRYNRESFIYSVRFRVGPFGITFDNKISNGTFVQNLVKGEQAEQSDIKEGDQLIAVDAFNTSDIPAKVTQRMMGTLSWPRVLVFQTKISGPDPREKELKERRRTFNMTIVYPPSLVGEYQFRLSEWAPQLAPLLTVPTHPLLKDLPVFTSPDPCKVPQFCPIYRIRSAQDQFGCGMANEETLRLPWEIDQMVERKGVVEEQVERDSQMLAMLLQEAASRDIYVEPRSLAVAKRGVCTFVQKAMALQNGGANLALIVNNVNEMTDMPAGKEKTDQLSMPIGLSTENDAILTHLAASNFNEIWAIVSESGIPAPPPEVVATPVTPVAAAPAGKIGRGGKNTRAAANAAKSKLTPVAPVTPAAPTEIVFESGGMTPACMRVQNLFEDIIDKFPHTVPPLSSKQVLTSKPPDSSKTRGLTEEGGRLALSGQNGWAFFDYHLAMFGPQEVPLGPFRLQMAMPPFGCDPGAYTVRIQGAVVAILRGGGCSFGIKVINAQKLGAKAVIIVNTDDMKTMRLMALPDEVPLIQIPCIMVSRRIQFYLEEQLRPYFPIDQHMVSIQPTGLFGDYEKRNQLVLPERLKLH